jgi:hypothetical protein
MDNEEQGPLRPAMWEYLESYVVDDSFYRL